MAMCLIPFISRRQFLIFYFIFFSGEPYGKILNESEYIIIFYYIYFIK